MQIPFVDHKIPPIVRVDSPAGRQYLTPNGDSYPSVTSVVGSLSKEHIDAWKERVGYEVAAKISKAATDRGSMIHENCENFITGKPFTFGPFDGASLLMFKQLMPVLTQINEVHAMETQMWSDSLKVAGTVDLIARMNGQELCIIDWKTSGRYKTRDDIHEYFMQTAAYSVMFYERTGIIVNKLKIAMTTEEFGLLLFDEKATDWIPKFKESREQYRLTNGK
jgi:hypothetical protein